MQTRGLSAFFRRLLAPLLSILMVVSLAPASPARAADPITITLNASDLGLDPAVMRQIVPEIQAEIREHGSLGGALKQAVADTSVPLPERVDPSVWPDFAGSVELTPSGSGLVITIPAGEITSSSFWQDIAAFTIGYVVGYGLRMLCIGSMVASGVGSALIPLICTPLQAAMTGVMSALVSHVFAGTLGTVEATRDIIIAGLLGLAGGFVWEKYLAPWAKANLSTALAKAGGWIRNQSPWLQRWFGRGVAENVAQLGMRFESQELRELLEAELAAWAGVASNLQRSLRIMPLGDSITHGAGSSHGGGYRPMLNDLLKQEGADVTFVGSQRSGPAPNAHEGHPAWTISQLAGITDAALAQYRPDVVLLHIGTNDMSNNDNPGGAPARLGALIDQIFRAAPKVTLLVSTIVPSTLGTTQERIRRFNEAIRREVGTRRTSGKHVYLVSMTSVTLTDLADLLHPNDSGYLKMAGAFFHGLVQVGRLGWIGASGGGNPAPAPVRGWFPQGTIASGTYGGDGSRVVYADLDGDGRADYIQVNADSSVQAWLNGGPKPSGGDWYWFPQGTIASGVGQPGYRIRFAPLHGTRAADYILMGRTGSVDPKEGGVDKPKEGGVNTVDNTVDLDPGGSTPPYDSSVHVWRNGGPKPDGGDWYWFPGGEVASGVGVDGSRIQFADLNADGRADYLDVAPGTGATRAWINFG